MQIGQRPQLWQLQDQTHEDKGDGVWAQGYSPAPHNGRACGNKGDAVPNGCPLVFHRPATALPPRKSPPCARSPEPGRVGNSAVGGGSVGARLGGGERENRVWGFSHITLPSSMPRCLPLTFRSPQTQEDKGDGVWAQGYSPAPHNRAWQTITVDVTSSDCHGVRLACATALPPRMYPPCARSPELGRVGNSAVGGCSVGARLGGGERENWVWGFSLRCIVDTIGSSPMCGIQYSVHL